MNCPKCGSKNRYDAVNCTKCGAPMTESVEFDEGKQGAAHNAAASVKAAGEKMKGMVKVAERRIKVTGRKSSRFFGGVWGKTKDNYSKTKSWFTDMFDGRPDEETGEKRSMKQRTKNAYDDVMSDSKKQKIAIGVIAGIVLILILLIAGGASCMGCSCAGKNLSGTWALASETADGYSTADTVIVLDKDGKIYTNGFENGSYVFADGVLSMNYSGMEFAAETEKGAENVELKLHGSDTVGMELIKISGETELTPSEIAKLYPDA